MVETRLANVSGRIFRDSLSSYMLWRNLNLKGQGGLVRREAREADVQVVVYLVDLLHVHRGGLLLVDAESGGRTRSPRTPCRTSLLQLEMARERRDGQMKMSGGPGRGGGHARAGQN